MRFYWDLNNKEKFIRSLWMGSLGLLFLYAVVWYCVDDETTKIIIPTIFTILYAAELFYRYHKWRNKEISRE
ncbi:hypothetical protein [Lysinibacillus fusiformis]|uniref:hypothetical protein n=1 Tax=Lysinibacillus fusiformis TaxID=28031 RepID=UPI0011A39ECF|nr:hypothetical protein [Lysinibacillus fusiformis]